MKKRWIPVIILTIAAAFTLGLNFGSFSLTTNNTNPLTATDGTPHRHFNTTIAVVNADTGTIINGQRYNYSAAIISNLDANFELVSPAMAQTGLTNGTYGAIITFPADVSTSILSFNANQPQRVQLDFEINPDLPEREFLEIYITITELQLAINTTLASTYVSSIFRQFHEAQDQVDGVFRNTLSDLMALEIITLADFTATLYLDEVPNIPLNPTELNVTFYMEQVQAFATEVSSWYRNSYAMASDQYLWMREGLFSLTENFPQQEDEWMEMLYLWTSYSVEYGELLEEYSEYVRLHEEALVAWHEENREWHHALEDYQQQVADWHEDQNFWFDDAEQWHVEYLDFLDEAIDYYEALRDFRQELEDNVTPVQEDLTAWKNLLTDYEDWLAMRLEEFVEMTEIYNERAQEHNYFLEDLLYWHTGLDEYIYALLEWKEEVNDRLEEMNTWQDELNDITNDLQAIINTTGQGRDNLPTIPSLPPTASNPAEIPNPPPTIPGLSATWTPPTISQTPVYIPAGPTAGINPADFPPEIGGFILELNAWHTGLQTAAGGLGAQQTHLQNTAIPQLQARQQTLQGYHQDTISYRQPLIDAYQEIRDWRNNLQNYNTNLTTWYGLVDSFVDNLTATNLPIIPPYIHWNHVELPPETELPLPEEVEALEQIELPDWTEILPTPPPYEGAEILEAFDREFPLHGNAVEPMYLQRPNVFENYTVPEMVQYHGHILVPQPLNPLVGPPPRPDGFWSNLDFMHAQLSSFDVGAFLNDDILRMVEQSLHAYDQFLQSVRYDIGFLFQDNIWLMHDIHIEYDHILRNIRHDALAANHAEQEHLHAAINLFATAREDSNEDTLQRLGNFAAMMPESRAAAGLNQELIDFTVRPMVFNPPELRGGNANDGAGAAGIAGVFSMPGASGTSGIPAPFDPIMSPQQATMMANFQRFQSISLIALAGVFLGTVISQVVSHRNRKKREEAEAKGFI